MLKERMSNILFFRVLRGSFPYNPRCLPSKRPGNTNEHRKIFYVLFCIYKPVLLCCFLIRRKGPQMQIDNFFKDLTFGSCQDKMFPSIGLLLTFLLMYYDFSPLLL